MNGETEIGEGLGNREEISASLRERVHRFRAEGILENRKIIVSKIQGGMDEIVSNTEDLAEAMGFPLEVLTLEMGLGMSEIMRLSLAELALPPRFEQLEKFFLPTLEPHLDEETRVGWDEMGNERRAAVYLDLKDKLQLEGPSTKEILEVLVANDRDLDLWEQLDDEHKNAFYQLFQEEFGLDINGKRQPANQWLEEKTGTPFDEFEDWEIVMGAKTITVPATKERAANKFRLAFVFVPGHEDPYLVPYLQGYELE
jgi:hypothetical protein